MDLELDREHALEKYDEAFKLDQEVKMECLADYLNVVNRVYPEKSNSIVKSELFLLELKQIYPKRI